MRGSAWLQALWCLHSGGVMCAGTNGQDARGQWCALANGGRRSAKDQMRCCHIQLVWWSIDLYTPCPPAAPGSCLYSFIYCRQHTLPQLLLLQLHANASAAGSSARQGFRFCVLQLAMPPLRRNTKMGVNICMRIEEEGLLFHVTLARGPDANASLCAVKNEIYYTTTCSSMICPLI
jgi:hypothetical protein